MNALPGSSAHWLAGGRRRGRRGWGQRDRRQADGRQGPARGAVEGRGDRRSNARRGPGPGATRPPQHRERERLPDHRRWPPLLHHGASRRVHGRATAPVEGAVFSVEEAIAIVRQVLGALSAAHGLGLVHRDVKLDNVFLHRTQSGERVVKVLDFGVAKVLGGHEGRAGAAGAADRGGRDCWHPQIRQPEQIRGKGVDQRADIYGAGLMLYTLIAGRGPFDHLSGHKDLFTAHPSDELQPPSGHLRTACATRDSTPRFPALSPSPPPIAFKPQRRSAPPSDRSQKRSAPIGWLETEPCPAPRATRAIPTATVRTGAPAFEDRVEARLSSSAVVSREAPEQPSPRQGEISTRTTPALPEVAPRPPGPSVPAAARTSNTAYVAAIVACRRGLVDVALGGSATIGRRAARGVRGERGGCRARRLDCRQICALIVETRPGSMLVRREGGGLRWTGPDFPTGVMTPSSPGRWSRVATV